MKYNKFIILYTSNFCERVNDFFCVKDWIENGYDIEYWDLSQFTCHETLKSIQIDNLIVKKISNIKEFEFEVKSLSKYKPLFLTWVNYCWYSAGFYETISKYNCDYAFFDNGLIPSLNYGKAGNKRSIKHILRGFRNRYYKYRLQTKVLKPAKYYFRLSELYNRGADKVDKNTLVGWCNSGDFEHNRKLTSTEHKNFIVFLDQYIPFHNDNILNGQKQIDSDKYYSSLNKYFSFLEKEYGIPVIIAAHPAAIKYTIHNPYEGREILFNKSSELVHDCQFVLAHFTTAISYVILNNKKMILLTSDVFINEKPMMDCYIKTFSELLRMPYVNVDHPECVNLHDISFSAYERYKYLYLTNKHSESISNFESILKTLEYSK